MFGNHHFDRVREMFADQFEPDGSDFIYRKSMKGAPIKVTATEKRSFIDAFNRRLKYTIWGLMAGTLVLILGLAFYTIQFDQEFTETPIYLGLAIIVAIYMGAYFRVWNAPERELARRPAIGQARTRDEMRQLMFQRMTYGQLALAVGAAAALLFKVSADHDLLAGWNRIWLFFAGLIVVAAAVQAFRKWRFESSSRE